MTPTLLLSEEEYEEYEEGRNWTKKLSYIRQEQDEYQANSYYLNFCLKLVLGLMHRQINNNMFVRKK